MAQAPVITSVIPMANARAAARTSPVTVNFSQPLTAASAGALKVFSSQRGGLRSRGATPAVVSGNALSFAPTAYPFMPGETVQYTVTTAAASSGGALAQGRVGRFTAAAGGTGSGTGTGTGNFRLASTTAGTDGYNVMAVGDVNGDGYVDVLNTARNYGYPAGWVFVRFNDGNGGFGNFSTSPQVTVGYTPSSLVLGDLDSDGDLDMLAASYNSYGYPYSSWPRTPGVSIRFNNGNGTFSVGQYVSVGPDPSNIVLGDIDADGDLDLLNLASGFVNVALNNGNGYFGSSNQTTIAGSDMALGDVDDDGDLDLLTIYNGVSIRLNNGSGVFTATASQAVSVGTNPTKLVLGDVDGDGDIDLCTANAYGLGLGNTVSVRLNNGSGVFSGSQEVTVGKFPGSVALGDVDGDGDLDLLTANEVEISVRQNNGNGIFSGSQRVPLGGVSSHHSLSLNDVDNDGDIDMLAANYQAVDVLLNGLAPLASTSGRPVNSITLYPNPAHGAATFTGATPNAPLTLLDALGRVRLTATADATGAARLALPAALPAGVYLVRSGGQVRRLVVE